MRMPLARSSIEFPQDFLAQFLCDLIDGLCFCICLQPWQGQH